MVGVEVLVIRIGVVVASLVPKLWLRSLLWLLLALLCPLLLLLLLLCPL